MRAVVLSGLSLLLIGCLGSHVGGDDTGGDSDAGVDPIADAMPVAFSFNGIQTVEWDGADGLKATWSPGVGEGELVYTLYVTAVGGEQVAQVEARGTTAEVAGLSDGEYDLRVEARDSQDRSGDGGNVLRQLVATNRVVYRGDVSLSGAADVWGKDDIVVLAGQNSNLSFLVVDVSDPADPRKIAEVSGEGFVKDIKIGDGLLFINGEGGTYGVRIFDFSDPANPVRLSRISNSSSVHNLSYGKGHLYLTDNNCGCITIYDVLTDPANPARVGTWDPPNSSVHDQVYKDGKLYAAHWSGFSVVDVSTPSNPKTLFSHFYNDSTAATHNVWPTDDHRYVLTTDETEGGYLRIFDVQDPNNVTQVADWWTDPTNIIHNVHVRGDYAFIAYYVDGMRVVDISDPTSPTEVGFWARDQSSAAAAGAGHGGMEGTWGVWPYGPHVAIGDERGLIIVDFYPLIVRAGE